MELNKLNLSKTITWTLIISGLIMIFSCGKTDQDEEWEEIIVGKWRPFELNGEDEIGILPLYHFKDDNKGYTRQRNQNEGDILQWEVKRGQLRVFYEQAPGGYNVAYDRYHSRSQYRLYEVEADRIRLTMFLYNGYQREFLLLRDHGDDDDN